MSWISQGGRKHRGSGYFAFYLSEVAAPPRKSSPRCLQIVCLGSIAEIPETQTQMPLLRGALCTGAIHPPPTLQVQPRSFEIPAQTAAIHQRLDI